MPLKNISSKSLKPEDYDEMFNRFEKKTKIKDKLEKDKTFDRLLTEFSAWSKGGQKGKTEHMLKQRGIPRYNLPRQKQTTITYKTGRKQVAWRDEITGRFTRKP